MRLVLTVFHGNCTISFLLVRHRRRPETFPVDWAAAGSLDVQILSQTDHRNQCARIVLPGRSDFISPHLVFEIPDAPAPPVISSRLRLPVKNRLVFAGERPDARAFLTAHLDRGDVAELWRVEPVWTYPRTPVTARRGLAHAP